MMRTYRFISMTLVLLFASTIVQAKELTVMISGGFKAAWEQLAPRFEAQEGYKVVTVSGPSMGKSAQAIPARLARGEQADVLIMVGDALEQLDTAGWLRAGSRVELADSTVGAVIKKGQSPVSINSEEALRAALLNASSIAYSDSASGRYVSSQLFKKLGIEERVKGKAHMIERIPVGSVIANGDYALGFQQVSELLPVHGVTFIGELPESVQYTTRFAGAVTATSTNSQEAKKLLDYLSSAAVQEVVRSTGLRAVAMRQSATLVDTAQ